MLLANSIEFFARNPLGPRVNLTADAVLATYIWTFYAAFLISFIFTPIMQAVATYYGIIDKPDRVRKLHKEPVAYLGGIAVFLGWFAGLAFSQFFGLHRIIPGAPAHVTIHLGIVLGACVIVILGLWDDIHGITPFAKILGQVAAALLLLQNGIGTTLTEPLLAGFYPKLSQWLGMGSIPHWVIGITSCLFTIALVVGCCNATNLLDGLDGLCGGVTTIIAGGYLFLATYLAMAGGTDVNWDGLRIVLALALMGGILGFIPYNFNPASIFMGDAGSMFIGYAISVMIILLSRERPQWFLASMVIFALPILDTSLAFARRWINGRPLFSADRHHFHHQLVARGLTVRKTVVFSYLLTIGFAILGCTIVFMRVRYAGAVYLVVFGSIVVTAYKMGMIHERTVVSKPATLENENNIASAGDLGKHTVLEIAPDSSTSQNVRIVNRETVSSTP
jgi:UDP-GlcNAc:undecaprenyl-phosphate GlcNAc-1-phosphate transferase